VCSFHHFRKKSGSLRVVRSKAKGSDRSQRSNSEVAACKPASRSFWRCSKSMRQYVIDMSSGRSAPSSGGVSGN
jgi:hypothetical protein